MGCGVRFGVLSYGGIEAAAGERVIRSDRDASS